MEHYTPSPGWDRGGGGGRQLGATGFRPAWVEGFISAHWRLRKPELPLVLVRPSEVRSHFLGSAPRKSKANPNPEPQDRGKDAMEQVIIRQLAIEVLPWGKVAVCKQQHLVDAVGVAICAGRKLLAGRLEA